MKPNPKNCHLDVVAPIEKRRAILNVARNLRLPYWYNPVRKETTVAYWDEDLYTYDTRRTPTGVGYIVIKHIADGLIEDIMEDAVAAYLPKGSYKFYSHRPRNYTPGKGLMDDGYETRLRIRYK